MPPPPPRCHFHDFHCISPLPLRFAAIIDAFITLADELPCHLPVIDAAATLLLPPPPLMPPIFRADD